tara:strand:+ start:1620 stop:3581 length:1962 start_codon:yes stop_codon:yes gene_type:complete
MSQNLLYKIDKAVKQNTDPNEIAMICREYLSKFPKNIRVLKILNNIKLSQNKEIFSNHILKLEQYIKSNQLQKAYDLSLELIKTDDKNSYLCAVTGDILEKSNHFLEALNYYIKSVKIDPHKEKLNSKLYNFLMKTKPSEYMDEWAAGFEILLSNKKHLGHTKLNQITTKAIKYFKLNQTFKILSKYSENSFVSSHLKNMSENELTEIKENIVVLSSIKVFLLCLEECRVCDIEAEKLLTFVRKFILLNIYDEVFSVKINNLVEILALNSFFNDYIFFISKEETIKLNEIENKLQASKIRKNQDKVSKILAISMYRNLSDSPIIKDLKSEYLPLKFYKYCILNPFKENNLIKSVNTFGKIENKVSSKVKNQYEIFPYPQWIYSDTYLQKTNFKEYINSLGLKLSNYDIFKKIEKSILIAGCGTGKEAVEYGELISDINITAVDLSSKSLGYALRKCSESKIKNINFLQGDILNLQDLNKTFDLVMSNGVIHHMEDPNAGFTSINKCLKKNGLLKLSLYSKIARRNLLECQELAKSEKISSHLQLRNFRNKLIKHDNIKSKQILDFGDFYNASTFKDLVLHEQEHTFNIQKIKEVVKKLNLKFCGFQNIRNLHNKFIGHYGSSQKLYDLNYWEELEEKYPDTFSGMYQFWCQKV